MSPFLLYFSSLFLLFFFHVPTCNAEIPLKVECNNTYNGITAANYTINKTFHTNLKILLPSLSSNVFLTKGFYNTSIGQGLDTVYGLVLCRGDATPEACRNCTNFASEGILSRCQSRSSAIWYDLCQLQYSDTNFFNLSTTIWWFWVWSMINMTASEVEPFKAARGTLMRDLVNKAAYEPWLGMFATGELNYSSTNNVYGLVQCKPVISGAACHRCLQDAIGFIPACCDSRTGGRVIGEVCSLRFEDRNFFGDLLVGVPAPSPALSLSSTNPTNAGRGAQSIGVCYGMLGSDLPSEPEVIEMYKTQNIGRMRLYFPNQEALNALKGSNIEVMLGLPNDQLQQLTNESEVNTWVKNNVLNYYPDVKFVYIAVGNEVIPGGQAQFVLPAMRNIYRAIMAAGLQGQIKVSTAVNPGVLGVSFPPSNGSFTDAARATLEPVVQFLASNQAPLLANVYPYVSYIIDTGSIQLPYALFTSPSVVVTDGQYQYQNLFDALVDAMYSALEKVGGSSVEIVVSESGWPSGGGNEVATVENARAYNQNLIQHVKNGTPKRSGRAIQTYIFEMFNENEKLGNRYLGDAERHFGLFNPDKTPVRESPLRVECNSTYNGRTAANYPINGTFHTNLKILLPSLSSNVSLTKGFYNTSIGQGLDTVYGLALCRGDATPEACRDSTNFASDGILSGCQRRSSAIWYDLCQLQYSDTNFFDISTAIGWFWLESMNNVIEPEEEPFKEARGTLMRDLVNKAAYKPWLGMFATGEAKYSWTINGYGRASANVYGRASANVYGLVQCKPVISGAACDRCLQDAIGFIPSSKIAGRVIGELCSLRFEHWGFFGESRVGGPAPPSTNPTDTGRGRSKSEGTSRSNGPQVKIIIIGTVSGAIVLILACIVFIFFMRKSVKRTNDSKNNATTFSLRQRPVKNVEAFLQNCGSLAPKRYRYSKLKKITNSFKDKLGEGGYGCVFKGKLKDDHLVAVKVLNNSKGNGEEFINEVASIGRTYHVNIVTLLGFCYEGSKRALIYEFMSNGSLEKFIYPNKSEGAQRALTCERLFQIAIGIARGLEYLHRGCNMCILHFDIKPHNILLDDEFCPKISDFGLAKLCPKHESVISMQDTRGTTGYIAPEVYNRNIGGVSHKSDVYSYGMMVLEMVGGRKNIDAQVENTSEIYFPHWVYNHIDLEDSLKLIGILEEEREIARKMVLVGLWCVQTKPTNRPSMSRVVEMLEGSVQGLEMPPKPYHSSP